MKEFIFDGNDSCLDFLNTEMFEGDQRIELLEDFTDIVDWLVLSGLIDSLAAKKILADGQLNREKVVRDMREFRSDLKMMVKDLTMGKLPGEPVLDAINQQLKKNKVYSELHVNKAGIEHRSISINPKNDLIAPIAKAVLELLTQKEITLIKKCSDPDCTIFFYDESKNHSRRWCSMSRCGNRAKASAHYKKMKEE